jgi:hypothetical protein
MPPLVVLIFPPTLVAPKLVVVPLVVVRSVPTVPLATREVPALSAAEPVRPNVAVRASTSVTEADPPFSVSVPKSLPALLAVIELPLSVIPVPLVASPNVIAPVVVTLPARVVEPPASVVRLATETVPPNAVVPLEFTVSD